jgi:hypothetical protein
MKFFTSLVSTALVASVAVAFPRRQENSTGNEYQPPSEGDLRGPCPGLNAYVFSAWFLCSKIYKINRLANHGFLPRNGRNVTAEKILQAAIGTKYQNEIYCDLHNWLSSFRRLQHEPRRAHFGSKDGTSYVYWLDSVYAGRHQAVSIRLLLRLDAKIWYMSFFSHGNIEHDASISRGDIYFGDNVSFNETIFQALVESAPNSDNYDPISAGATQKRRLAESQATNPNITNTDKEFSIRSQESALYLSLMGDPITGIAPKEWVFSQHIKMISLLTVWP